MNPESKVQGHEDRPVVGQIFIYTIVFEYIATLPLVTFTICVSF